MAEYIIQEETLVGIADAIRSKTGESGQVAVTDMADKISGITVDEKVETTVALDFSAGDMEVVPEDGTVFSSVSIPTPTTLIPANIAEGVDIAGIIGTLAAGGNVKVASGTYNGNGAATQTISHNLGEIPDVFVIYNPSISAASNSILLGIGVSDAFRTIKSFTYPVDVFCYSNGYKMTSNTTAIDKATSGVMHTATSSTIKIGNSSCKLSSNVYHWFAIGGLT